MNAKNLYLNRIYDVKKFKNVLYIEIDKGFIILDKTDLKLEQIEFEYLYSYYILDNESVIYEGFYTTDYKWLVKENEQLSLF